MSTNATAPTGSSAAIPVRDIHFDLSASPMLWHGGSAGVTGFYDALSACFPLGEAFFIRSVKRGAAEIDDPALNAAVRGFVGQESVHSREHRAYNKRLSDAGYDVAAMERAQAKTIKWIEEDLGDDAALGITACMEHMTSVLAGQITYDEAYLRDADPAMRELWVWHAMEEAEHGAVAFDVLAAKRPGYFYRVGLMLLSTWMLFEIILRNYGLIARTDRAPRALREMLSYLFWSPGFLRRVFFPYLSWYRPGFHPFQSAAHERAAAHRAHYDALTRKTA
ncbi:MAG: metal-dependent hydrolase [Parvularculaceae bacterium]